MRLFVSVPIPVDLRSTTEPAMRLTDFRPVPAGTWHMTLQFLGDVEAKSAHRALDGLDVPRLPASFSIPGAFPKPAAANVLWMGVRAPGLDELAATVRERTQSLGGDGKPFRAHVTLGRFRKPVDARLLLRRLEAPLEPFRLDRVQLMGSELTPAGPEYHVLSQWITPDADTR